MFDSKPALNSGVREFDALTKLLGPQEYTCITLLCEQWCIHDM